MFVQLSELLQLHDDQTHTDDDDQEEGVDPALDHGQDLVIGEDEGHQTVREDVG